MLALRGLFISVNSYLRLRAYRHLLLPNLNDSDVPDSDLR